MQTTTDLTLSFLRCFLSTIFRRRALWPGESAGRLWCALPTCSPTRWRGHDRAWFGRTDRAWFGRTDPVLRAAEARFNRANCALQGIGPLVASAVSPTL